MAVYQSPGVYVKELPGGSKPIEGVGTAIAAFIGMTEKGPTGVATMISNCGDYARTFGGFVSGYATPLSIYGYFDNGGGRAYVVRVNSDSSVPAPQALLPGANPALKRAFVEANQNIHSRGQATPEFHGMGTTGTATGQRSHWRILGAARGPRSA